MFYVLAETVLGRSLNEHPTLIEKAKKDPSLAVAHSDYGQYIGRDLFTEFHPEVAVKWEEQQTKQQEKNLELEF